jgi:hypothetical protein
MSDIFMQMFYLDQIFYKFTINLTKLSILTLYLRIFTQPWFVRTCWCCFAIVTIYAVASILVTVFQCTPINYFWDHHAPPATGSSGSLPSPHCVSSTAFWLANAVYNISTDVIILVTLPFMIWSLRLPRSQKFGLTFVFGLGIFVFATSVLRMTTLKSGSKARDPLVGTVLSTMWTMIEASIAVVCACLPMCRTPLQKIWPKLFPSRYASAGGAQSQTQVSRGLGSLHNDGSRVKLGTGHQHEHPPMPPVPREVSGGLFAGHHGPGGRTLDDEEDCFEDLEMQSTSRSTCRDDTDQKDIIGGVVPMRMKGW